MILRKTTPETYKSVLRKWEFILIKRSPGPSLGKKEEHQGIRICRKTKRTANEKQNKRTKPSIFHRLTPLFSREGQG